MNTENKKKPKMDALSGDMRRKQGNARVWRVSINPLFLLVAFFLLIFLGSGMLGRTSNVQTVPVGDFIRLIKDNKIARVDIQNDGEILAQEKYFMAVTADEAQSGGLVYKQSNEGLALSQVTVSELITQLKPQDAVTQLRGLLGRSDHSTVVELIIGENFVIGRTADRNTSDYIVKGVSEEELNAALRNEGLRIDQMPLLVSTLRSSAESSSIDSISARAGRDELVAVYEFDSLVLARLKDEGIRTYGTKWDAGISTFANVLQEEGISLTSSNFVLGSVIVNSVPWGDIISILTLVGFVVLAFFLFRGMQSSGSSLMRFGQSKARMFWGMKPDITFKDVAGVDEAKEELDEIVQFLKTPDKFRKLGARIPKGVLMVGAPGTGKTLLARAIAGEAGVPFFHTSGSEFEEMLVGAGASRVRDLFDKAKKASPALIFIDEIDAVARKRGTTIQSSTTEQTLNQILVEMDGFEQGTNVIVIAATNRPDVLDPAILRPGRFDRRVVLDLPDIEGRKQILAVHAKNKPLAADVDLERVAKRTIGFSGAELENTLNEAAIIAAKDNRSEILFKDIEEAATKVTMGPVRRSLRRSDDELRLVGVHEAGHALVSRFVPESDPVHRVSVLSRGMAGGVTHFLPQDDNRMMTKTRLLSRIVVALGGRAAEEVVLGDVSTGASGDIDSVTNIVRNMVQKYGMSEKLGLLKYGESNELQYLGYGYGESRDYSEETAKLIDQEIRGIVDDAYARAVKIIRENRQIFDKLVELLLDKEVLEAEDFEGLFVGPAAQDGK